MIKKLLFGIVTVLLFASCGKHFISDRDYREQVHKDFKQRKELAQGRSDALFSVFKQANREEKEALEFLYAYMPLSDLADYDGDFFLQQVRGALKARETFSWGNSIPEDIFRHFVLVYRVNNENLDSARQVFFNELKPRVENMTMYDAALEVNHWCHEKVAYRPSDSRTSAPLATVRTALGRCGEESTFTVTALRSVGIPARQCYTPRWAHTDDNHAWVEVWVDGKWHFLGACEPEPILDLGWFNSSASRVMLTHTKAFGKYPGPEEVVMQSPNYTEINLTGNYAKTAKVDLKVTDGDGNPVDSARVDFMIYNYSEFYPAISKYTDTEGRTFLSAGLGDMLAWASKDGKYGFAKISFGKDSSVGIILSDTHSYDPVEMDIVPPAEDFTLPEVTFNQRAENDRRMAVEDSIRTVYTSTFPQAPADPLLVKSMGNHETIEAFLSAHPDPRARTLLESLSDKDLRDATLTNLLDSYDSPSSILCPRVENEFLSPYKSFLKGVLQGRLSSAQDILRWTRDSIAVIDDPKAWNIPMSPEGVYKGRVATPRSRDLFFVSLCRALGIEAREDPVTGKVQYKTYDKDEGWTGVDFSSGETAPAPKGTLVIDYSNNGSIADPKYYNHFTVSKISGGRTRLMTFDEGQVDMGGGVSWANSFRKGVSLDAGTYVITSGLRLADGSVPVTMRLFDIRENETTRLDLTLRAPEDAVSVIGTFDADAVMPLTGRGSFIMGVLGVGQEPTNHTLRDIAAVKEKLEAWGRPILLLTATEVELEKLKEEIARGNFGTLPSNVLFSTNPGYQILKSISTDEEISSRRLPVFIVANSFGRVFYLSQGYTIGLGERLSGIVDKL